MTHICIHLFIILIIAKSWDTTFIFSPAGILKEDIALFQDGTNLIIDFGNNSQVTIKEQSSYNMIEEVKLSNGNFVSDSDIDLIIQNMTAYAQDNGIALNNIDDVKNNQNIMQIVSSGWN